MHWHYYLTSTLPEIGNPEKGESPAAANAWMGTSVRQEGLRGGCLELSPARDWFYELISKIRHFSIKWRLSQQLLWSGISEVSRSLRTKCCTALVSFLCKLLVCWVGEAARDGWRKGKSVLCSNPLAHCLELAQVPTYSGALKDTSLLRPFSD